MKNAERFLSNRGKTEAAVDEQESVTLVHSVEAHSHWETPLDQENAARIHMNASLNRDAVAHVHSNMATPGQEDATPVHQDTTIEQGETALVYRDAAVKQRKPSLRIRTQQQNQKKMRLPNWMQNRCKETPLEPQEVPDNSRLKVLKKATGMK